MMLLKIITILIFLNISCFLFAYQECSVCNYKFNPDDTKNCLRCGMSFSLKNECSHCGYENNETLEYCEACGKKIAGGTVVKAFTKKNSHSPDTKEKKLSKTAKEELYDKFQEDYTARNIDHYNLRELLTVMNMKGDVATFVKKGTISGGSWGSTSYGSIAVRDHYQLHSLPKAVIAIIKHRTKSKPQLKTKIYQFMKSSNQDIKISAMAVGGYIDDIKQKKGFLKQMISSLSDKNHEVQIIAMVNIIQKIKNGYFHQRLPKLLISILNNPDSPPELIKNAINAYLIIVEKHFDLLKELNHKESCLISAQKDLKRCEENTQKYEEEKKNYTTKETNKIHQSKINTNKKMLQTYKTELKKLEKELPELRKSYKRKDKLKQDGLIVLENLLNKSSAELKIFVEDAIKDLKKIN